MKTLQENHRWLETNRFHSSSMTTLFVMCIVMSACESTGASHPAPAASSSASQTSSVQTDTSVKKLFHRPTPLSFGTYVTPEHEHNPITPPERFTGFHVGTDFEVSAQELDADVPVYAVCPGKVLYSGFASGYGGLLIYSCTIENQDVTVINGHLAIDSLPNVGTSVESGDQIGILGAANSHDTDGNRKHLHFGIHKGTGMDTLGYVQTAAELDQYMDAAKVVDHAPLSTPFFTPKPYWKQ